MIAPAIKQNMKSTFPKAIFLSALLISAPVLSIAQSVVYDNTSTNFQATSGGRPFVYAPATKTAEFGDQITLATSPNRNASLFQFYYYYNGAASDLPTATVRFYSGAPSASSLFYTSDAIPLSGRDTLGYGRGVVDFSTANSSLALPDALTWTVQFANLGANTASLLLFGPPTVGSSFNDFWENSGTWQTMQITGLDPAQNSFGAQVTAVPEPGVLALGALALLARLGMGRYSKRHRR